MYAKISSVQTTIKKQAVIIKSDETTAFVNKDTKEIKEVSLSVVKVDYFVNKAARETGRMVIETDSFFIKTPIATLKEAYDALKALYAFEGAVDV